MEYTLEDHLSTNFSDGLPSHWDELFRELMRLLEPEQMSYAFAGALAMDLYIREFRYTTEIWIVGEPGLEDRIGERLATLTGDERFQHLQVIVNCSDCPANRHTLQHRVQMPLFGTVAPFASPLSVAWLFLEGDLFQERVDADLVLYDVTDAGQLLYDGAASAKELHALLEKYHAKHALARLAEVQSNIERGGYSGSYSDSVKARMARLKR